MFPNIKGVFRLRSVITTAILIWGFLVVVLNQPYLLTRGLFTGEWTPYYDAETRITIEYPGNWVLYRAPTRGFSDNRRLRLESKPLIRGDSEVGLGQITIDYTRLNEPSIEALAEWARDFECEYYGNFCNMVSPVNLQNYNVHTTDYPMREYNKINNVGETVFVRQIYLLRNRDGFVVTLSARESDFDSLIPYLDEFLNRIQL